MREREQDDGRDPRVKAGKFELGRMIMTPGAQKAVPPSEMMRALRRHARGDWGEMDQDDKVANDRAVTDGGRLVSSYLSEAGAKFWVITEADRSATTVLLPEEY